MRDPQKLLVAQRATALAVAVYRLTSAFPAQERFGLVAQMRRAAVSVGSNIAEGCGRGGERDFLRFLYLARGSATELAFQLTVATALDFGAAAERVQLADDIDHLQRMLNRFTSSVRSKLSKEGSEGIAPPNLPR